MSPPPSTTRTWPVIHELISPARNSKASTRSLGGANAHAHPLGQPGDEVVREHGGVAGSDRTRCDRVDGDVLAGELAGHRPRHRQESSLGHRVVEAARRVLPDRRRRLVDDHAAAAGAHQWNDCPGHDEDARQVDIQEALPQLERQLLKRFRWRVRQPLPQGGVIDEDVGTAEGDGDVRAGLGESERVPGGEATWPGNDRNLALKPEGHLSCHSRPASP